MVEVSCIGQGLMGSALARALLRAGHNVTVWNRSAGKARAIVDLGGKEAQSFHHAVNGSEIVLVCIDRYPTSQQLFSSDDLTGSLEGRIIVQLSTGTPKEAREADAWFRQHGASYLDGAFLCGPAAIGSTNATLVFSGSDATFDRSRPVLSALGNCRFVGLDPGAAAALDIAWLVTRFATYLSAAHGAMICESEGLDLNNFAEIFPRGELTRAVIDVIASGAFKDPPSTLNVGKAATELIKRHALERRIDSGFPDFFSRMLDTAQAEGYGDQHIASIIKVLRRA